jgi:uncharacterized protein (TIGR01777 family)
VTSQTSKPLAKPLKIVIPGGSGQVGTLLARHFHAAGHHVTVLSRSPKSTPWQTLPWDGRTLDPAWTQTLEAADAVIHLSGRSVNCRYNAENRRLIIDSRVIPTELIGRAIAQCARPPKLWMNASTSTFYRDARDRPQDEFTGELEGPNGQPDPTLPDTWLFSYDVARRWEEAFNAAPTPATRKIALRSSMTMSPDPGGVFSVLSNLVRLGLGGAEGPGDQYVSWIHDRDYIRATEFLIAHEEISGPVNLTSPNPLLNRDFLRDLRRAWRMPIGLPAATWMLEIGAFFLRTETELILKSRRAIPTLLLQHGFTFDFASWPEAAQDLVDRYRNAKRTTTHEVAPVRR